VTRLPLAPALLFFFIALALCTLSGCGGASLRLAAIDDMEHVRGAPGAQEGAKLAPEAYARAEQERALALAAHQAGDDVGATLHAQRAVAAYDHALVVARLARATAELADAQKSLDDASGQAQALEASHAQLDREGEELEQRVRIARERLLPAQSAAAKGEREAARLVATRSLAVEARLLCDAARLASADATSLADADGELTKLEGRLDKGAHPAPIDDAARARAHCLDALTRARRAAGEDAGSSDALLSELSASGGWDPVRDERGVVVTLHAAFHGAELAADAAARLKELGRIAGAHPGFALQLVVHDAQPPPAKGADDAKRADAAVQALVGGGAAAGKIKTELAGARAPMVDPADAKDRARNERLDVVFVATGK
jgi:hypothetical protein